MSSPPGENVVLAVRDFSFRLGTKQILRDVSFPGATAGSISPIVGPNGAGKTTLLR